MIEALEEIRYLDNNKSAVLKIDVSRLDLAPKIRGFLLPEEKRMLFYLASVTSKPIVELGTFNGLSTYFLCLGASKNDAAVTSVDVFDKIQVEDSYDQVYHDKPSKADVENTLRKHDIKNFTLVEGKSADIAKTWTEKIGLLFIDANHDYERVMEDIRAWTPHLAKDGLLIMHDANIGQTKDKGWLLGLEGPGKAFEKISKDYKRIIRLCSLGIATNSLAKLI